MSIEAELIQEIKALRGAVERVEVLQERAVAAMEQVAAQFDNVTEGGNSMIVEGPR